MFEQLVGCSMPQCLELIEGLLGRSVPDGFVNDYQMRTTAALKSDLKAAHHAFERMRDLPDLLGGCSPEGDAILRP
jgi:hypothetical protein